MLRTLLLALIASLCLSACAAPIASRGDGTSVTVGIAAINDFHGGLEPRQQAGGAAWLASAIDGLRGKYRHSLTVSAGDLIGASPLVSALFLDEPAVEVMNRIALDFNAVGNHEFDRGQDELLRMQAGGCEQHTRRAPCRLERFAGARFSFLAASTFKADGTTLFPATAMKTFGRGPGAIRIGLIGLTLKATPELVSADGIKGLTFGDEADAINAAAPRLRAQGADAVVVLIHQGGRTLAGGDPNGCEGLTGEIVPILDRLAGVDVVVSGHTHAAYVCDYKGMLLTSAGVNGAMVTDIALSVDPVAGRVTGKRAVNVLVGPRSGLPPRADIAAYVARYAAAASREADRLVGRLAGPAARRADGDVDFGGPLGNLLADAQLAATRGAGANLAFMNPFGVRAPLTPGEDGVVTFGMIHAVQPFDNALVTQTLTGAQIRETLEQGFADSGPEQFLTPSHGFAYQVDRAAPAGSRISAMVLDGVPIDPAASYRVTTNSFLADGGDGFTVLRKGGNRTIGGADIAALETWLAVDPPRPVPDAARVREAGR